jgi:hypothetical protein
MMGVAPITPDEAERKKRASIPNTVFEAFNKVIVQKLVDGSARVPQKDVIEILKAKGLDIREISDKGWLHIESSYEAFEWKVDYDSEVGIYTFTKKGK